MGPGRPGGRGSCFGVAWCRIWLCHVKLHGALRDHLKELPATRASLWSRTPHGHAAAGENALSAANVTEPAGRPPFAVALDTAMQRAGIGPAELARRVNGLTYSVRIRKWRSGEVTPNTTREGHNV